MLYSNKEAEKGYKIRFTQPDTNLNRFLIELKAVEVFDGLKFKKFRRKVK